MLALPNLYDFYRDHVRQLLQIFLFIKIAGEVVGKERVRTCLKFRLLRSTFRESDLVG